MEWVFYAILASRSSLEILRDIQVGPLSFNILALAGLAVLALAAIAFLRRRLPLHPLALGWAAFLVALLPSVFIAYHAFGRPGLVGAREWVRLLTLPAVFLLAYGIAVHRGGRRIINLLFLSLPIPLGLAIYQRLTGTGFHYADTHRVHGTLSHPNSLGFFLMIFIGLTFWKYGRTRRPLWLALLAAQVVILVWTANVGAFVMILVLCVWVFIRENRMGRILAVGLVILLTAGVAADRQARTKTKSLESVAPAPAASYAGILIEEAFPSAKKKKGPDGGEAGGQGRVDIQIQNSMTWRYANWRNLLSLWRTKPVLGFGLQTTGFINPWKTFDWDTKTHGIGYAPHNDFLRYLVEAGGLGFFAYLLFLAWTGAVILFEFVRSRDPLTRSLLWVLAGVFLAWQVGGLADNLISTTAFQFVFWAALGAAIGQERRLRISGQSPDMREPGARIALTTVYPLDSRDGKTGGIETFIRGFAASAPDRFEVRIVGISVRGDGLRLGRWNNVEIEGRAVRFFPVMRVRNPDRRMMIPLFLRFTFALLRRRSRISTPEDIYIFHRFEPAFALPGGAKRILIIHGDPRNIRHPQCESRWRRFRIIHDRIEPGIMRSMSRVFVVCSTGCAYYQEIYPEIRERFAFLPVCYDPRVFRPLAAAERDSARTRHRIPKKRPVVLFAARLESAKDPLLAVDAFAGLRRSFPEAMLVVAGDGGMRAEVEAQVKKAGLTDHVVLLGWKTRSELAELMAAADVFLLTSAFEAMPTALLEALACGLPAVAVDAGEVRRLVRDGENGLVVRRDPEAIAEAMATVLKNPPRPENVAASTVAFTREVLFRRLFEIIEGDGP